jgi:hypothetical protein
MTNPIKIDKSCENYKSYKIRDSWNMVMILVGVIQYRYAGFHLYYGMHRRTIFSQIKNKL